MLFVFGNIKTMLLLAARKGENQCYVNKSEPPKAKPFIK